MYCRNTTVCCYTCVHKFVYAYKNLHNFFSTLWKHLTQKLCGVCMERSLLWILSNYHKHVTVLQISALYVVDQHSMCTATVVVVQSA